MRARVCFQLALLTVSISLATGTQAQTPAVKALGSDTLTFEEAGSGTGSGAAYTSSVAGLNSEFYQNQASIDITAAGAPEGQPNHTDPYPADPPELVRSQREASHFTRKDRCRES